MFFLDLDKQTFEQEVSGVCCQKCGHNKVVYRGYLKYLRLLFIPVAPVGKSYTEFCYRCCRNSILQKPKSLVIPNISFYSKFLGTFLFVLVLFGLYGYVSAKQQQQLDWFAAPQKYDHYFIDQSLWQQEQVHQPRYQIARISKVDGDQVYLQIGNYNYLKKHQVVKAIRLDNMMINNYFSPEIVTLDKADIQRLAGQGSIYEVQRPKNLSIFGGLVMRPEMPKAYKGKLPNPRNIEAINLYHNGDLEAAFTMFSEEAKKGDAWAQLNLAQMYRDGEFVPRDVEQALYWFERSSAQNNKKAQQQRAALCAQVEACL